MDPTAVRGANTDWAEDRKRLSFNETSGSQWLALGVFR
jgi:hypothetical protein